MKNQELIDKLSDKNRESPVYMCVDGVKYSIKDVLIYRNKNNKLIITINNKDKRSKR